MKTKVIFKMDGNDPVAFFPEEPGTNSRTAMTSDLPLHIQQAKFRLHLHLASKGRNSPRETGNPSYLPELLERPSDSAPEAVHQVTDNKHKWFQALEDYHQVSDNKHKWFQTLEDYQLEQIFTLSRLKRSKITPLVIENLIVWGAVIAAAWWLMTR